MVLVTKTTPVPTPVIPAAAPAVQKQALAPKAPAPVIPAPSPNRLTPVPPGMVFPGVPEAPVDPDEWLRQNSRPVVAQPARTGSPALDATRADEWLAANSRPANIPANFDTGALDNNTETEARNAANIRTGIGEPIDGVLPGTLSRRDSHIVTTRELAGAVATGETLRETIAANETRVADLSRRLTAINQYATQNPVAAREMSTFGNIVTRPMTAAEAAAMLQSQLDDVRQQTTEAQAELTANAADRDALTRRLLEGETRQTRGAAAFNAGLAALAQTGTETLRGLGIGADMVEYLLTGDTTDNALVTAMDDAREYMSRVLPVDRNGFFTNLASGFGSFAGFMTAGFAAKAISGGSRLLQGLTVGTLGGAQQGAAQADMAMEGTIGQEIARLQFNNPGGVNDEQIAALEDALAIVRYQSFLAGFGLGMTELVPIDRIIARAERASGGALSQRLRNAAAGGFEEGLQEFFQTSTSDAIQQALADPDHPIDWEGAAGAAVIGFLLGAGAGGVLVNVNGREVRVEDLARERNISPGAAPGAPGPSPAVTPPPEGVPEGAEPADTLYPAPETVAPGGEPATPAGGPAPVGPVDGAVLPTGPSPVVAPAAAASTAAPTVTPAAAPVSGAAPGSGPGAAPAGAPVGATPAVPVPVVGAGIAGGLGAAAAQPQPVTQHQRTQLAALGYTPAVIRTMTPAMAQEAIVQGRPAQEGALTAQPTAANADEWLAANSRPVNWTPPAGVKSPEAPNVAVQPSPAPAESAAAPPADAGRVPDGGGVSGVAAAPAGVGGGVAGGPVPPGGQNARVGALVQNVGKLPARRRSLDLLQFIASIGGIRPTDNLIAKDAHRKFLPGYGKFVRPDGRDPDEARELVAESGYFGTGDRARAIGETTIDDLEQLIDRALAGERITPDDADDMAFEAERQLTAEHERYLGNIERDLLAWMQAEGIEDRALLRMAVKVADESAVMYGMDDATAEHVIEHALARLADQKIRKVIDNEIPFFDDPEPAAAVESKPGAAPRVERPGDTPTSGGEGISGGRPGDGAPAPTVGGGEGQEAQGPGAAAENPDADRVNRAAAEWDRANRSSRNEEWQAGAAGANPAFNAIEKEGLDLPAHGMAKESTLGAAIKALISILTDGIDPNRQMFTAPLTSRPGGSDGATGAGHAYRDGPFVITFRRGLKGQPTRADITGVLVNPAHPEIAALLQRMFPDIKVRTYDQVADIAAAENGAVVPPGGLTLVHGSPNPSLRLDDIAIVRDGEKQGKRGSRYGGLYTHDEKDAGYASDYAAMDGGATPTLYDIRVKPGTRIFDKPGDITRLSEVAINDLVAQGYGVVRGKDPRGRSETVVIDRSVIESLSPRAPAASAEKETFKEHIARLERERDEATATLRQAIETDGALRIRDPERPDHEALIGKGFAGADDQPFRLTWFHKGQPTGHMLFRSIEDAAQENVSRIRNWTRMPVSKPRPAAPAVDQTDAGQQFVLPGAEQISDAEYAQNLANKPLRPAVDQKPADDGLFGDSAAQMDLVDMARKPEAPAPQAEAVPVEDYGNVAARLRAGETIAGVSVRAPDGASRFWTVQRPGWQMEMPSEDMAIQRAAAELGLRAPEGAPVAVDPEQAAAGQETRLTAEGPWDFNDTYPDIDRRQYERLLNEKPDPFDAAGEPTTTHITEMIDAILSDLQGRHTAILRAQEAAAKAKPAGKKEIEARVAGLFEAIKGLGEEMRGIWPEPAVDAILAAGRKRAVQGQKGVAPKPAEAEKPAFVDEQAAQVKESNKTETILGVPTLVDPSRNDQFAFKSWHHQTVEWDKDGYPTRTQIIHAATREEYEAKLREAQAARPAAAEAAKPATKPNRLVIETGAVFRTPSGRTTSPVPKLKGVIGNKFKQVNAWLLEEAKKEVAGGDQDFQSTALSAINLKNLSQSDKDTMNMVLFGDLDGATEDMLVKPGGAAPSSRPAPQSAPNASWVIKNKATGEIIMETFDQAKVDALNTEKYVAVPIKEHLASLNRPAGAVEMTADVEGVTFHETPIPADVRNAWYIATGEKGAMFTLRQRSKSPDGGRVIDAYIANLSRDKQEAIRKAKQHVKAAHRSSTPDPIYWGAPEVLNDIEVGAGGSGSSGSAVEMPTEMVDPITAAGLAVKALTAKSGRTYWAATGDLKKHEAILDQLGFAPLRKINNVWQRSYFTSDPTAALAEALTTGKAPLKEPAAPLPVKDEGPAIDPDVAKAILAKAKIVVTADKGGFVVTGKTFDIKSEIKEAGGRWDGAAKGWRFSNDPTQKLAALAGANAGANAGADGAGDAGTGIDPADDARLRAAREREDARADERVADASRLVSDESKELIRRGLKFGIPAKVVNEQIEDVGMIVNARERKKPMFLLANEAGTGKTFVMGAAIRELRNRGQKRFIYVTQSQDLIAQIERDLAPYGLEGVEFATYSKMPTDAKGAVILFDETHNIKNLAGSQRGKNGADLIAQADFTVFASATPFQNPVEAKYLEATGIYGQHEDAHSEWAKMYGAAVRRRKFYNPTTRREQVEEIVYWPGRGKKKDGAAARQWFFKQGVMTQRAMQIDPGMVDVAFTRAPVAEQYVRLYKDIEAAYETVLRRWTDEQGNSRDYKITSEVARHRETTIKRVLEAAKGPAAIARAKEIIAEGKNVVLFVETKAERTIGKFRKSEHFKEDTLYSFPEMQKLMEAWAREAEAARGRQERPPPQPFASFIYEIARGMHDHGILHELPSVADDFMEAMGGKEKVAVYTGAVAQAAARKNKEEFLSGKKKVLVATMAKGGTGLSLHDTVGNRETVQLNINLPWAAWQVDQVSARVARYGLKSKAKIEWMFASNIDWETTKLAPRVGARMEAMGAIVKGIEVKAAEKLLGDFDFEGDVDVKQDSGNTIDVDAADGYTADDDIYANAARLERGRVKASDTTGGFFETPYPLAALMTRVAGIRPGDKVLEPSAGTGNLLEFIPTDAKVTAIEVRRDNLDKLNERLRRRGITNRRTLGTDFIEWSEHPGMTPDAKDFDVVLMNPPFEREAGVGALDVAHVERAYGLLKPGGRLVAIMGEGSFFRQTKQEAAFREWLDNVGATVVKLPENAFKKSGTGVRTRMVVIDKDRPGGRSTIDLADMESASLRGIELTIPSRPSEGVGTMEEWGRLGLGGMAERDRKDRGTTDLFAQPPKPVAPAAARWPVPKKEPVDSRGRVVLGAFDPKGLPLGEAAQEYVVQQGKALGVEFFVAFDATGKVVGHQYGTLSASGQLVETTLAFEEPNAAVVTHHNHPSSRAPSLPDLLHLSHEGHAEMWVHAHNGSSWRLSLTPQARQQWRDTGHFAGRKNLGSLGTYPRPALTILGAYNEAVQPIARGVGPAYRAGKIAVDDRDNAGQFYMIEAFRRAGVLNVETNAFVAPDVLEAIAPDIEAAINEAADAISQRVFGHAAGKGSTARRDGGRPGDVRHAGGVGVVLGGSRGGPVGRSVSAIAPSEREAADSQPQGGQGLNQPAWHGSWVNDITRFMLSKIGTGEGHQVFGWGLYFTSKKAIAEWYRDKLSSERAELVDETGRRLPINIADDLLEKAARRATVSKKLSPARYAAIAHDVRKEAVARGGAAAAEFSTWVSKSDWDEDLKAAWLAALKVASGWSKVGPTGALYRAEIPEDTDLLLWDKTFEHQPPKVQAALVALGVGEKPFVAEKRIHDEVSKYSGARVMTVLVTVPEGGEMQGARAIQKPDGWWDIYTVGNQYSGAARTEEAAREMILEKTRTPKRESPPTGQEMYRQLGHRLTKHPAPMGLRADQEASHALRAEGVLGIKYLDGSSRTGGDGAFNFVVFDENAIEILEMMADEAASFEQTQTAAFKRWFGASKVVDAAGKPLRVYHGTTGNFDVVRLPAYFTEDQQEGSAYTFSGSFRKRQKALQQRRYYPVKAADVGVSPGRVRSIGIISDIPYDSRDVWGTDQGVARRREGGGIEMFEDLVIAPRSYSKELGGSVVARRGDGREAYRTLATEQRQAVDENWPPGIGDGGNVMPAYLSIKNPKEMGPLEANRFGARLGGTASEWVKAVADLEAQGYDGIVTVSDEMAMFGAQMGLKGPPARQWLPFHQTQIKSATGNSGAFDPSDPSTIASQRTAPVVRPERRADTAVIANNIQAIVTRLLGRRIRVDFSDTIGDTNTSEWDQRQREIAAGGAPMAATAGGQYSHDRAAPARSFLRLALADPLFDPTDSAYHEAWHHIEMALTNAEERDLLRRDLMSGASGLKRLAAEHLHRTGFTDDVNLLPAYEVTAIAFEGYARMRRAAQPVGPLHIGIRRFFDGIMELLERIKVMLGRRGIKTWEDVFEAAYRGDFRNRTPVSAWAEVTGAAEQIAKYGSMSDEGQAEFNSQPGTNPFDRGGAQARQATLNKQLSLRQPLDRVLRIPFDLFGGMNRKGEWKPGLFITKKARTLIRTSRFSDTGRFRFLNTILHKTRANLSDRYGLDPDYIERDRMRGLDERATLMEGAEVIETLAKAKVGSAEAKILQAVLNGEAVTDAQMEALAQPIRMAIDALGQEAVELGLLSAESFERNRGAYLHRVYMKHESGQNGLVKFVNNIKASNRKRIIGAQFKGRGLWQEVPATELTEGKLGQPPVKGMTFRMLDLVDTDGQGILPDTLEGKKARVARRVYIPAGQPVPARYAEYQDRGVWEVRGFRNGKPVLWRDYTKAEREKMGEITDARYTIAKTFMVMAHDLATGRFYRDIAMNESWAQSKEPLPGTWKDASEYRRFSADPAIEWVRVPETKISKSNTLRYGALAGKYVRAEIWRDLNELAIMQTPTFWNTLLTQWKVNKTARSPVTHMNNVVANLTFMDLNDVGMIDLIGGIKSMVAKDAAYDEAMANGAFGSDMVAQELRNDILAPLLKEIEAQTQGNAGTLSSKIGFLGKFAEALWSAAKAADKGALRLYQLEDEVFRMALYNRRRRQGYPPREAALDARDTFLNYDIRAPLVNAARRTVLPFIAYPYRAIPGIAKAITTHPWKLAKYVSVAYAVNAATYALLGFDDDDEDRERRSLRDSEQGSTWIGLPVPGMGWLGVPRMVRMPWNDAFGNPVFLDIRRWIPAGDVFDLAQSNSAISLPPWLQLGGPLAIAAEIVFNKSLFTGDPLINELTDDMWERGQTVADYLWKAVMPGGPWIPGSWYWEKIVDAATGARDWSGRPYDLASAIASAFGIKLKPQDVENGFALHAFAYEEVERALRAEMNRLGRDAANNQITQAEFERQMAGIIADMERLTERRMETFTGAP